MNPMALAVVRSFFHNTVPFQARHPKIQIIIQLTLPEYIHTTIYTHTCCKTEAHSNNACTEFSAICTPDWNFKICWGSTLSSSFSSLPSHIRVNRGASSLQHETLQSFFTHASLWKLCGPYGPMAPDHKIPYKHNARRLLLINSLLYRKLVV